MTWITTDHTREFPDDEPEDNVNAQENATMEANGKPSTQPRCPKCGHPIIKGCGGDGWMESLGPYSDGSYITSRPCRNDNPYFDY